MLYYTPRYMKPRKPRKPIPSSSLYRASYLVALSGVMVHGLERNTFGAVGSSLVGFYVNFAMVVGVVAFGRLVIQVRYREFAEGLMEKMPFDASFDHELHVVTLRNRMGKVLEQVSVDPDYDPEDDDGATLNQIVKDYVRKVSGL